MSYYYHPPGKEELLFRTEQEHSNHQEPCDCAVYTTLLERRAEIMAIDMKDSENVKKFSELFIRKKKELALVSMTPDQLLDHIKELESALEWLIFDKRAEIQGARDFYEEALKSESAEKVKALRERDKSVKYRPSLNQLEESQKQAKKAASANGKTSTVERLMRERNIDKKKADVMYSLIKTGMSEDNAAKMVGC